MDMPPLTDKVFAVSNAACSLLRVVPPADAEVDYLEVCIADVNGVRRSR